MANVYSKLLYGAPNVPTGLTAVYDVPTGYVAVVRSVTLINIPPVNTVQSWAALLGGIAVTTLLQGTVICAQLPPDVRPRRTYVHDLHHVLPVNDGLELSVSDAGWSVLVSGYELLLP